MGLEASLSVLRKYSEDYTCKLLGQALMEPYPEIQLLCARYLLDARPDDIFYNFSSLLESTKDLLKKERYKVSKMVDQLIKTSPKENKRLIYNMLGQIGDIEQIDFFMYGVKENDEVIKEISREKIDKIMDWYDIAQKNEIEQYRTLLSTLAQDVVEHWERYENVRCLRLVLDLELYDLLQYVVMKGSSSPVYIVTSVMLQKDVSENIPAMMLRLVMEKEYLFTNYGKNVILSRKDSQFVSGLIDEILTFSPDNLNRLFKRLDFPSYIKDVFSVLLETPELFEKTLVIFAILHEFQVEKLDFLLNALHSPQAKIRLGALGEISVMKYQQLCDVALKMLADESDEVKLSALEILRQFEFDDKLKAISALLNSENEAIRKEVMRQIATISFKRYMDTFEKFDKERQSEMARVLAKIDENLVDRLATELSSIDSAKRLKALKIIQLTEKSPELSNVIEELLTDPDLKIRATAIRMVQFGKSISAMTTLMDLLVDKDGRVRANAIEAIEELADMRFIPVVEKLMNDRDNRCRANAIKCLWKLGGKAKAIASAENMLNSPELDMRLSAVWVIDELRCDGWKELLSNKLENEINPDVRKKIMEALLRGSE